MNQMPPSDAAELFECKREAVLRAAKQLFIAQGYGATSMDAIAAAAGVSKATVYAHHAGKKALFAAVTRAECQRVTASMAVADDIESLTLGPALRQIAASFMEAICAPQSLALLRMVATESNRFPELGAIFYDCAPGQTLTSVTTYLERLRARGLIDAADCETVAAQFLGAVRGDVHLRAVLGLSIETGDRTALIEAAVATFVARYATQPR
ncbi:TetR/AcrR family transcriptional regulator [Salinisphaera sp. T31B1]|uniref:TetR/AcrR family transcriptional regulator n=1 Tax=Salinisphaera sp. T31B1 TaxID=727963 RepID=UPI003341F758